MTSRSHNIGIGLLSACGFIAILMLVIGAVRVAAYLITIAAGAV